ncbi:MAG: hypothetical protein QM702_00220 [Rubrivivax sp.]
MAALGNIGYCNFLARKAGTSIVFDVPAAKNITTEAPPLSGICRMGPGYIKPAYMGMRMSIRGTVKSSGGVGIARIVLAIDEEQKVVGDWTKSAGDGTFELRPPTAAHTWTIVHIPAPGDSRNGVCLSLLTPVAH